MLDNPLLAKGINVIKSEDIRTILMKNIQDKSVLDIGCAGNSSEKKKWPKPQSWLHSFVAELSNDCIGIDIDYKELADIKNKIPQLTLVGMSGDAFRFNKKFDYVIFNWCINYVNPYKALDCARSCLKKDGKIIIGFTNMSNIFNFKRVFKKGVPHKEAQALFVFDPILFVNFIIKEGFEIVDMFWAQRKKYGFIEKLLVKHNPYFNQYFLCIIKDGQRV